MHDPEPNSHMLCSKRTLILAVAAAVLAVACSEVSVVATVDDSSIGEASVTAMRHSYSEGTTYGAEAYRADLTNLIYLEAQKSAAERDFGLTDLDDPALIAGRIENPTTDEAQVFANVTADPDRTDAATAVIAEQFAIRDAVVGELVGDAAFLADVYANRSEMVVEVCARHIVVSTIEEAEDAVARINEGEDFAVVADEMSLDTASAGGLLPCPTPAADFVSEFSAAILTLPLGELSDPVRSEFGWHVVIVDDRTGPETLEALAADPPAFLHPMLVNDIWIAWVNDAVRSSSIEVASQVGSWTVDSHGILPPPVE